MIATKFETLRAVALPLLLAALAIPPASSQEAAIPGFSPSGAEKELATESRLAALLDPESTGRHFRILTEEPHPPGSARNHELAVYTRDRFIEYGLEDVTMHRYDVLLPLPREVSVAMVEPVPLTLTLREDGYPEDKDSYATEVGITYTGMSGSGDITAQVVYAHSGNPADYDWLESQGIDPRGKIALVRYSVPYSYRGFKAWEAERRGVAALIIYSDPMEDGYRKGEVFPNGPWGPESHIQRGAIAYDFLEPGDPLTPGWASVEGARRIAPSAARAIPKIIAVPMSWRDAVQILERLGGPVAPAAWQGALPITYRVGPGAAKLRVKVDMDQEQRPIWVVTGRVRGSELPDQSVILGNHRDAWVYGGVDPSSGSATLLETARVLGDLARSGHRPRRSIVLASWDAEELHLTGSTEWGEQFGTELGQGAIAYLNVDSSTSGPDFQTSAVAALNPVIASVARDVIDPNSRRSLLEATKAKSGVAGDDEWISNELGSGSDYTVFLNFLGVPVADLTFNGPYGVYHSQYDDYLWMTRFGDPGFRYMTAMVEVWGRLALRLANAEALPLDYEVYAERVAGFLDDLERDAGASDGGNLDFTVARRAIHAWRQAAQSLASAVKTALATGSSVDWNALNRDLIATERALLLEGGIPGRPWFRHALYAPRYTYAAMSLPGAREAVEAGNRQLAQSELARLAARFDAVAEILVRARAHATAVASATPTGRPR